MKITATRKEDILREKAAYEEREAARKARYDESNKKFREAEDAILEPLKTEIERALEQYTALTFMVRVERNWRDSIEVRIQCNENEKFDDDVALAWDYTINVSSKGEVKRETSSWSGLKATTEAQMTSLRQTLAALETINGFDWEWLLSKAVKNMPQYEDYFKSEDVTREPRPDFEAQLLEAELEELVGTNKLILVQPFESAWYRGQEYVQLVRETPKQYEVRQYPYYRFSNPDDNRALESFREDLKNNSMTVRVAKKNIVPVQPIKILEA